MGTTKSGRTVGECMACIKHGERRREGEEASGRGAGAGVGAGAGGGGGKRKGGFAVQIIKM